MKFLRSKKALIVILSTVLIIIMLLGCYWYYHPTHYKYNDRFVIGNNISTIVKRYGEFDKIFYNHEHDSQSGVDCGGYIIKPRKVGFLGTYPEKYYMIYFIDGKADSVAIESGGWGG